MATEDYVTYKELTDSKQDIMEHIEQSNKRVDRLDNRVEVIGEKVSSLNDLVLPLTVAMKQTAENTREISESLKDFTNSQRETNGIFHDKINSQAIVLEGIKFVTKGATDKKKYNVAVVVAMIGLAGAFITGLFQLAPIIFNG